MLADNFTEESSVSDESDDKSDESDDKSSSEDISELLSSDDEDDRCVRR